MYIYRGLGKSREKGEEEEKRKRGRKTEKIRRINKNVAQKRRKKMQCPVKHVS